MVITFDDTKYYEIFPRKIKNNHHWLARYLKNQQNASTNYFLLMSDQDQARIYCGNGKKITTQYGDLMKLSFSAEDLQKLQDNLNNGWVNAVLKERREPSAAGTTHYIEVDTWKPKNQDGGNSAPAAQAPSAAAPQADEEEISAEDLPF